LKEERKKQLQQRMREKNATEKNRWQEKMRMRAFFFCKIHYGVSFRKSLKHQKDREKTQSNPKE